MARIVRLLGLLRRTVTLAGVAERAASAYRVTTAGEYRATTAGDRRVQAG